MLTFANTIVFKNFGNWNQNLDLSPFLKLKFVLPFYKFQGLQPVANLADFTVLFRPGATCILLRAHTSN